MLADIIIHMDRGAGCTARLMAAIELARQHGARLKGLYVINHPHHVSVSSRMADFEEVRGFFINAASKAGITAEWLLVDWGVVGTPLHEIVMRHVYYADTILVGQPAYLGSRKNNLEFHERLILGSGRPVVVFPASGDVFRCGTRILVAWRGGREAARAVHDALPFLQQAAQVTVVSVVATPEERLQEQRALADLVAHLEHSRVRATTELVERRGRSIGEQVLERAAQLRADLIVVGGFAYKPNRAPVLSPLTRELLVSAPVPLMIAH